MYKLMHSVRDYKKTFGAKFLTLNISTLNHISYGITGLVWSILRTFVKSSCAESTGHVIDNVTRIDDVIVQ